MQRATNISNKPYLAAVLDLASAVGEDAFFAAHINAAGGHSRRPRDLSDVFPRAELVCEDWAAGKLGIGPTSHARLYALVESAFVAAWNDAHH